MKRQEKERTWILGTNPQYKSSLFFLHFSLFFSVRWLPFFFSATPFYKGLRNPFLFFFCFFFFHSRLGFLLLFFFSCFVFFYVVPTNFFLISSVFYTSFSFLLSPFSFLLPFLLSFVFSFIYLLGLAWLGLTPFCPLLS
jgi:hypothetical protein